MREGHVNNAVSFLTNPSVQDASESQRLDFLRNKGLTQEEIDEAYSRANDSSNNSNKRNSLDAGTSAIGNNNNNVGPDAQGNDGMQQQQQQQMYRQPPRQEQPMWARYLIPGTLALSASAGLAFLYRTMVLHERNGGGGRPFGNFGSFMGFGGPAHQGMQPPPHMQQNSITNGPPGQPPLPVAPQNNTGMYGQAPYGMPAIPTPAASQVPPVASSAAAGETQLVPKAADSLSPGLTPLPQGQLDRLAKAMEKQTEMTTKVCETVQEVMKASAKQQEEHIAASASKDAALLKALLASQSTQSATNEIRAELASIKALVLSTLRGDLSSSDLAQAVSAPTDATTTVTEAVAPASTAAPSNATNGGISSSEGTSANKTVAPVAADTSTDDVVETNETQNEHQATKDKHIKASREALAKMCVAAEIKTDLAKGLNMLLMYIGNLRKDPDVPRFRRIARQNSNYKKSLESLEGHVEFLKSLGFVERSGGYSGRGSGGVLEWSEDWLSSTTDWANDVLDDAITNLEGVKRDVNDGIKAAREAGAAGAVAASSAATGPSVGGSAGISGSAVAGVAGASPDTETSVAVDESRKPVAASSPAVSQSSPAMQSAHAAISSGEETKSNETSASPSHESIPEAAAAQPMSYVDVMKMVQEGKTPPGVKQIPNKLTADAQELTGQASSTPPPKPWETAGEQQASEVVVDAD